MAKSKILPIIVDDEIDLLAIWQRIKLSWIIIVICTLLMSCIAGIVSYLMPPKYDVTGTLSIPASWNMSSDAALMIVQNLADSKKYSDRAEINISLIATKTEIKNELYEKQVLVKTSGKDIDSLKSIFSEFLTDLTNDQNMQEARELAYNEVNNKMAILDTQLSDTYRKKQQYEDMLTKCDASLILGYNPAEINDTLLELENQKADYDTTLDTGIDIKWAVSPTSSGLNTNPSVVIVTIAGGFLGMMAGCAVAIFRKY